MPDTFYINNLQKSSFAYILTSLEDYLNNLARAFYSNTRSRKKDYSYLNDKRREHQRYDNILNII